jgi:hypothetical protein
MKRKKKSDNLQVMRNLASVEQYLEKLKIDFENSGFRPNELVRDGIEDGFAAVSDAVESLSEGYSSDAAKASTIAWLHAYFARGIFDAEMAEHYLGEGDFLELDEQVDDWKAFVKAELVVLEEEILTLRKAIKSKSGGAKK